MKLGRFSCFVSQKYEEIEIGKHFLSDWQQSREDISLMTQLD